MLPLSESCQHFMLAHAYIIQLHCIKNLFIYHTHTHTHTHTQSLCVSEIDLSWGTENRGTFTDVTVVTQNAEERNTEELIMGMTGLLHSVPITETAKSSL